MNAYRSFVYTAFLLTMPMFVVAAEPTHHEHSMHDMPMDDVQPDQKNQQHLQHDMPMASGDQMEMNHSSHESTSPTNAHDDNMNSDDMSHASSAHDASMHQGHDMDATDGVDVGLRDPHAFADGYDFGPISPPMLADRHAFGGARADRLEWTAQQKSLNYDIAAWYGYDFNRLVFELEGDAADRRLNESQSEILWQHAFASFWDTQLGFRFDTNGSAVENRRYWGVFGIQGLAPYWFEVDARVYLGQSLRTAAKVGGEYELLLTQRLILQPRLETTVYGKSDSTLEIGSGLSTLDFSLRLRYEIWREIAPYVGVVWQQKIGKTADIAANNGESVRRIQWIAGVRFWF